MKISNIAAITFLATAVMTLNWHCVKPPEFSDVPYLEFRSFSKTTLGQGSIKQDSTIIVLYFTDGDGNFGNSDTMANIYIKDLRTNEYFNPLKAPMVPTEGANNGISGTISLVFFTTCCIYPASTFLSPCERSLTNPTNDLGLEIFILDRKRNKSNLITTPPLTLDCTR